LSHTSLSFLSCSPLPRPFLFCVWLSAQHCLYFEMFKPLKRPNHRLVEFERDVGRNWRNFFYRSFAL
jgi:hypothetical protein